MSSIKLFSSGVIDRKSFGNMKLLKGNQKLILTKPDKEVNQLYNEFITLHSSTESFDFKTRIIKCTLRLMGDPVHWFNTQMLDNDHLHGSNLDLIEDTLRFILTGKRKAHISVWENIIRSYPEIVDSSERTFDKYLLETVNQNGYDNNELYIKWILQKNGINDMLRTIYILFGGSDISYNN